MAKVTVKEIQSRIEALKGLSNIQSQDGNWNYEPYAMGLANGLILAVAVMDDIVGEPPFKSKPNVWLYEMRDKEPVIP